MRDAITALEAALAELENARAELPKDLAVEVDEVMKHTRDLLDSLRTRSADSEGSGSDATA